MGDQHHVDAEHPRRATARPDAARPGRAGHAANVARLPGAVRGRTGALGAADVLALQRAAGNAAVARWLPGRSAPPARPARPANAEPPSARSEPPTAPSVPSAGLARTTAPAVGDALTSATVPVSGWLVGAGEPADRHARGRPGADPTAPWSATLQRLKAPPTPPKTEWNRATVNPGKGAIATDSWLSYNAGDAMPVGGVPAADPPGYAYIRAISMTNLWIRFHLVNALAGGPGTADNLVPASQKTNQHPNWKQIEQDQKDEYNAGHTYHFAAQVTYHPAHGAPTLAGHAWQEYFPKQIDAALSTWKKGAWHTSHMAAIVPNLPPMNPKQIDYDLTGMTGGQLNNVLETDQLGGFIAANAAKLVKAMDGDTLIEELSDLIADVDNTTKKGAARQRNLFREYRYAVAILRDYLNGIGVAKINMK